MKPPKPGEVEPNMEPPVVDWGCCVLADPSADDPPNMDEPPPLAPSNMFPVENESLKRILHALV